MMMMVLSTIVEGRSKTVEELHMMMMVLSTIVEGRSKTVEELHMMMMVHIHLLKKLHVSNTERLDVPERHVRVQFQQRDPSCIRVDRIEMRFEVVHSWMRFHGLLMSDHHRSDLHGCLPSSLVATRFP
jgi:hypothetical protein